MLSPIRNFSFLHYSYAENPETNSTFVAFHNSGFAFSRRNCNKISIVPFFSPVSKHLGSDQNPDSSKERARKKSTKLKSEADGAQDLFVPRKPRRGKKSEAVAVEDFVRDSLKRTIESIRKKNSEYVPNDNEILKEKMEEDSDKDEDDEKWSNVVEEDEPYWPLDAEIGWGIRASDYFDKYKIQNVAENGEEIDWEGEMEDTWVKEINCLEWESFAFHPSPLMVLVFERYNRASDNWKVLKELEKAIQVYWNAKDCLPPRTVKIDINIERDLAYALKAKECPQLLFLRGNRILHREKEIRTADELVQMIAYFYYNAKKPSWFDAPVISSQ